MPRKPTTKRSLKKRAKKREPDVIVDVELHLTAYIVQHFAFTDFHPLSHWKGPADLMRIASQAAGYLPNADSKQLRIGSAAWAKDELQVTVSADGNRPYVNVMVRCPLALAFTVVPPSTVWSALCFLGEPIPVGGHIPHEDLHPDPGTVRNPYPREHKDNPKRNSIEHAARVNARNAARTANSLPLLEASATR